MKAFTRYTMVVSLLAAFAALTSCGATDTVAKYAASSFAAAAKAAEVSVRDGDRALLLRYPGGEELSLLADFSGTADAVLSLDAAPFLASGLDTTRLQASGPETWALEDGRLLGRFDLASEGQTPGSEPAAYIKTVAGSARKRIGYHAALKHYGVMLGEMAMVEWAADLVKNDKDLVIVLDPAALRQAGVAPEQVTGWTLADVPVEGPDGKMTTAEKLLKAYDLR